MVTLERGELQLVVDRGEVRIGRGIGTRAIRLSADEARWLATVALPTALAAIREAA